MSKPMQILVACRDPRVLAAIAATVPSYTLREAFTTDGVYAHLSEANLAIVDRESLVEGQISAAVLRETWEQLEVPHTDGAGFLEQPAECRYRAAASSAHFKGLPPRVLVWTSYSGGVGKTTIALDLATYFAAQTKLPTAVLELTRGPSALRAVTGLTDGADLFDAATQGKAPGVWRRVTLVPFDDNTCSVTPRDLARSYFHRLAQAHILTIVDAEYPHPFFEIASVESLTPQVFVLAAPKPDAWANAARLKEKIPEARVVFNLVDGANDRLAQVGLARALDLPRLREIHFDGALAKRVLPLIYPGWKEPPPRRFGDLRSRTAPRWSRKPKEK